MSNTARAYENLAVPASLCKFCGYPGVHVDRGQCIDVLRDRIASLEMSAPRRRGREPKTAGRAIRETLATFADRPVSDKPSGKSGRQDIRVP